MIKCIKYPLSKTNTNITFQDHAVIDGFKLAKNYCQKNSFSLLYLRMRCICHCYAATEISCVHSTPHSSHPIFFSNLGHMSLVPKSRRQSILGTPQFHLWPLGGQKGFSCGHSRDLSFQLIFFIFTPNMCWTKI